MEWAGAQLNGVRFTHGTIHSTEYTGIPLRTLLREAGPDMADDKWVCVKWADASSSGRLVPTAATLDDVLIAFKANGEALRMKHGYPVGLVVPGWEGTMWIKWPRRIKVTGMAVESREETSKYIDVFEDGVPRQWTWVMDAKSVITAPSPQMPLKHGPGPLVISGLARSGDGQITRVDVSKDGGITRETARLSKQGDAKALTRQFLHA